MAKYAAVAAARKLADKQVSILREAVERQDPAESTTNADKSGGSNKQS